METRRGEEEEGTTRGIADVVADAEDDESVVGPKKRGEGESKGWNFGWDRGIEAGRTAAPGQRDRCRWRGVDRPRRRRPEWVDCSRNCYV